VVEPQHETAEAPRRQVIVGLSVLAYFSMLSYALARPATESLFLAAHGKEGLPSVWLLIAALMVPLLIVYVRLVSSVGLLRLYLHTALWSALAFVALAAAVAAELPYVHYLLYSCKDIYIVVLIEVFYAFANAYFPIQRARWYYGLFGAIGAIGSISGNLAVGPLAKGLGAENVLWLLPPILLIVAGVARYVARHRPLQPPKVDAPARLGDAARVLRGSSYLVLVTALIAVTQLVITFVDFSFNGIMSEVFPDTDQRAGVIGQVYAGVAVATFAGHAITGPVLRLVSVPGTLLAIPLLLTAGLGLFVMVPGLATVVLVKIASKGFDYTLFRSAKEILYIPLSYAEKTQGKFIVDVFTYRVAKGAASLLLLGLLAVSAVSLVEPLTLALMIFWVGLTVVIARRFRRLVPRAEEMKARDEDREAKTEDREPKADDRRPGTEDRRPTTEDR